SILSLSNRLGPADADLGDAQPVGDQYFQADSVAVDALSRFGHVSQPFADQSAHRGGFDIFFAVEVFHQVGDAIQVEASRDNEASIPVLGDIAFRFVLVANLADDDFQQVFHGGQA